MREALCRVVDELGRRYRELKARRAGLDFADLELGALDLLRSSGAVGAAWRGRFAHIMVDEFQDTSRVQLELVEALRGPDTRVFRVGDEHQSIYRFRNADLEVFRAERRRVDADPGADLLPLRGNFRSTHRVVDVVNLLGEALIGEGFNGLEAARSSQDGSRGPDVDLCLTLDEGNARDARRWRAEGIDLDGPPTETQPKVVAEARFAARRLRELVDAGEAERGDIVVLLRAFTHVDAYEEAFRRAGLEPYVVGGRGYWSQQQVDDLLHLLGTIANPLEDEALFGTLASPAVGVSPDALWLLRAAAGQSHHVWPVLAWRFGDGEEPRWEVSTQALDEIPGEDEGRLRSFCATLAGLRAEAPVVVLDELLERAMNAFGYDLALLARPGGAGRMANVRKLQRLAREFEEHEGRDLRGFLEAAQASIRRDEREGMAPAHAEGHDGVRVMTVHAAKGLEFPVVCVPDLGRRLNAGGANPDVAIGTGEDGSGRFGMRLASPHRKSQNLWDLDDLLREEAAEESEEGARLIYVAATRAQNRLVLSGVFRPEDAEPLVEARSSDTPLRRLLPALASRGWTGGTGRVEPGIAISISEPSPGQSEVLREVSAAPASPSTGNAGARPPLLDRLERPVPVGHLSYSALADYERCGYRFYVERVLGLRGGTMAEPGEDVSAEPDAERDVDELVEPVPGQDEESDRDRSLGLGNAVHAALEWSARHDWGEPAEDHLEGLLRHEGLAGRADVLDRARAMVRGWLSSPLRRELDGTRVRPEAPFALPLGGTVVRGKIDLLADESVPSTVIDFKTDTLDGARPAALGDRYAVQRSIYALAAAGGGEGPVRAVHCFLEAPGEPIVEDFDAAALSQAREALESLVARIRAGGFAPTASPYPALCFGCPAAARLCTNPAWTPRGR
jgi:ATP-dependent exoDNAse (exonuclease V) beta subunit